MVGHDECSDANPSERGSAMIKYIPILFAGTLMLFSGALQSTAFIFADENNPNRITHPTPYTGTGGDLEVSVCIATSSESQSELLVSLQNSIVVWNQQQPVSPNLFFGANTNIPPGAVDFESTLLHELGHCIGLAHPNAATESGLAGNNRNYTKAGEGANTTFDLNAGTDGIIGSADDVRGDDVNLHWFELGSNNPLVLGGTIDGSTYSRDLADLPPGDLFAANADRTVANALGFSNTEAVMQQGAFQDEDQRRLTASDIAGVRLGMSGLDRTEGTADDYRPRLVFGGVSDDCDISVEVSGSSFAFCSVSGAVINGDPDHVRITSARAVMGSASHINWFFNQESILPEELFSDGFES